MKEFKQLKKYLLPSAMAILAVLALFCIWTSHSFKKFSESVENKTFDIRQNLICKYKKPNKDIVILAIDDVSYEYILNKYGSWPISRDYWANVVHNLNKLQAKLIVFDMLFVNRFGKNNPADKKLIDAVNKNDNVIVAIDFDNYPEEVRKSTFYPDSIKTKLNNSSIIKNSSILNFSNSRGIIKEIQTNTPNIGVVNVVRDDDGVIRKIPPYVVYKGEFYSHLATLAGLKALGIEDRNFDVKFKKINLDKNHKIPLENTGRAILNWYGGEGKFKHIPLYKFDEAIQKNDVEFLKKEFEGKIVYIGATVVAMSDIKTTPISLHFPGVEIHTTFLNNIIDNNLIQKAPIFVDVLIALLFVAGVAFAVFKTSSILSSNFIILGIFISYFIFATLLMSIGNVWIGVILPYFSGVTTYLICYIFKYILKSKDYEQTYKLAVTDALTELYNHRFFQEKMTENFSICERYGNNFSIIMIDIDHFKKFNDTYGHQSGDIVLKQVASTIKRNVRSTDIPCRYGGEEMTVILTNTNKEDAITTANKICQAVREKEFILAGGENVHVTISVGVATSNINGSNPQELIEYADKCLYVAKENGRNQVVVEINP